MILVIDNYDSFVNNLSRYAELSGYETLIIRNDQISIARISDLNPEKIIISPGPGEPKSSGIIVDVVKTFFKDIPILGVCLGHQAIGYAFGAKIKRAILPMHGMSSIIYHDNSCLFRSLPNPLSVGRYHSLIVDDTDNTPLIINAISQENEIMALKHKIYPTFGVQFHPESILTEHGLTLLNNFLTL